MLDVVIVDDERLARSRLVRLVSDLGYEVIAEAQNATEAMNAIESHDPAVVLLDIEMPGETGLQLAEKIGQLDQPPAVIFTTAYDQYALEAFSAFAVGYLLKPINQQQLATSLDKAQTITKAQLAHIEQSPLNDQNRAHSTTPPSQPQNITVNSHRGVDLIPIDSIRCFIADSKYISVVADENEALIDGTLKQLEAQFNGQFVRVHRNALVAKQYIGGLERAVEGHYTVRLKGIQRQPVVSRRYLSKVKAMVNTL